AAPPPCDGHGAPRRGKRAPRDHPRPRPPGLARVRRAARARPGRCGSGGVSDGLPFAATASIRARARIADYATLSKPGITAMAAAAALASALVSGGGSVDLGKLVWLGVGTALVGAGSNALNMLLEREVDGRMRRTMGRPLPA